jgi:uncharacterized cupredoxin-like copper-binding protein
MQAWLKWTIVVVVVVAVLYGALVAVAEVSDGKTDQVYLSLGTKSDGKMYMRCDTSRSTPGVCTGDDQTTVTIPLRDRVTLHVHNDDAGDHSHDFNIQGWQYAFPPVSPEMELHQADDSWTFTAWASGSYHMLCELPGHDGNGMHGTFVVQ